MKKLFTVLSVMVLVFAFTACGGGSQDGTSTDDGQNPVMNFVGNYACDRANIFVECNGDDGARMTVTWGSSAWDDSEWIMTGTFDTGTLQFEYHDCVRTDYKYKEDGEVEAAEEVYTGGHGFMQFTEGDTLTLIWQDDQENVADGMVFEYIGTGEK